MSGRGIGIVVGLWLALAMPAMAQSNQLLTGWRLSDMRMAFANLGMADLGTGRSDSGAVLLRTTTPGGLNMLVYGTACQDPGERQFCYGAEFSVEFTLASDEAVLDALTSIDYAAVSFTRSEPGILRVSRYIILDDGITRGNLEANLSVFTGIADEVMTRLSGGGGSRK
jgi:hypothetical protein